MILNKNQTKKSKNNFCNHDRKELTCSLTLSFSSLFRSIRMSFYAPLGFGIV